MDAQGSVTTAIPTAAPSSSTTTSNAGNTDPPNPNVPSNSTSTGTAAAAMAAAAAAVAADEEAIRTQKLVEEFQYLLEKSQSLFSGLSPTRDLPPTGSHRQWRPYFEKTFEVYTKLWKFQQSHRPVLENKNNYGLKRWEVGEIASKIGQLYYHYYLRTSETNYLYEAYIFYEAIHERQYFKDILEVKNPALMIKKMRYYARFIVVCLLLNKDDNIRLLISELEGLIDEYTKSFKMSDAKEWQMVLDEISTFMEAEKKLVPISTDRTPMTIMHRLPSYSVSKEKESARLKLQEAILVGNYHNQIKFSELTLDMYRMLQSLERKPDVSKPLPPQNLKSTERSSANEKREPGAAVKDDAKKDAPSTAAAGATAASQQTYGATGSQAQYVDKSLKRSNPHKYLLYRPSLSQLLVYISTAYKDIGDNAAMLLYLSADGIAYPEPTVPGYGGGVATSQRKPTIPERSDEPMVPLSHCLHPADLTPFTRKPLFLIVDSSNSTVFKTIPAVFDQPVMCLLSPLEYPSSVQDKSEIGSLFTLFLHTPLLGFCSVSDIGNLDQAKWDECVALISTMEKAVGDMLLADPNVDIHVKRFMSDDFLWYFIVRFVLCGIILRCHFSFKEEKSFPTSFPALPESVYVAPDIINMFHELTMIADVNTYFSLPYATPAPTEA
ncbi:protein SCAI [Radiomyces spectabilis]|uniref:protein SCAI n=1 Tax=Radiomyces spectabilis TaxID=64574 RepID=UPI00221F2C8A|nr:protein SCAI [Radiomyces spectabilis]KAI8388311.1 protein SCAI [Radiomyces spectabilis]